MKFDQTFLRSKVARRILGLFICCAMLPITVLAVLSFTHVTRQLNEQSQKRLHQATKAVGMAIYERLLFLENEMKVVGSGLPAGLGLITQTLAKGPTERLEKRFKALILVSRAGRHSPLFGRIGDLPESSPAQREHISGGKTVSWTQSRSDRWSRIFMMRLLDAQNPEAGFLVGEINPTYLYGVGEDSALPPMTELFVLDSSNSVILSSVPVPASFLGQIAAHTSSSGSRHFKWTHEGTECLASYWKVFMKWQFLTPEWTIVLSQSEADVLAPMADFTKTFPLVVLLSLWVVLLLSTVHIRRSLVPLEKLKQGTERIARGEFDSRVTVTSGDEFEDLAASFNAMSGRLGTQFKALSTMGEIGHAVLSALETDKIIQTVLTRMPEIMSCNAVSVGMVDPDNRNLARTFVGGTGPSSEKRVQTVELQPEQVQALFDNPQYLLIHGDKDVPGYAAPLAAQKGVKSFLVLPIFLNQRLTGIITLGYEDSPARPSDQAASASTELEETVSQARQLADQVAVALSNAHLIEELDRLNWGTLTALARAVDAKSPWTAGHSERVTNLAVKIGHELGFAQKDLDILRRAALLHDVGKIGVPMAILDKPKKLTVEEWEVMKQHPQMGGRILEPISAYADVLPIVMQHHERLDGQGYPHGLSGQSICLGARILAVADVFDAMASDRPYRAGWDQEHALEHIKQRAGEQFDPEAVNALIKITTSEGHAQHESTSFGFDKETHMGSHARDSAVMEGGFR